MRKHLYILVLLLVVTTAFAAEQATGQSESIGVQMTHRMMMLVIQLGLILFAAKLGSILFEKMKMAGVLGEITAGILVGPYLLGSITLPGFPHGLFPIYNAMFPISPELYGICAVASIVLMFMVGLETDINLFLRYSAASSLVGIGGVVFSFILGDLSAIYLLDLVFHTEVTFFSPPCLLLGVISTATSVGITARVLSEKKHLDSPEGVTILSGAVIDDVLGIILLAVCMGVITASKESGTIDWIHIGIIAAKAVGIWLSATVVGLLMSHKISLLLKHFKDHSSIAIMSLGLALMLAGLFEEAGLAMIIGAYIMGLSLSKTDISHVVMEKLGPVYRFLIPIFFAVMGMLIDLSVLTSPKVLIFGLGYTAVAVFAKIAGCAVPALCCNFNMRGSLRIGFGMLPRGEVALIVAGIGLSAGLLSPEMFGAAIIMTMFTTIIAPAALVLLFANQESGMRKIKAHREMTELVFDFPSVQTAELLTHKLVATFEGDGFFSHLLDRNEHIYQFRKDNVVIGFRQEMSDIFFNCELKDIALVNTVMLEVMAELEQTVRELRKPVDVEAIGRRLQDEAHGAVRGKILAKHISVKTLQPHLAGRTKNEIIDELLNMIKKAGFVKDIDEAKAAVMSREESMSTGMQYGIALPHGRTDVVDELVCAIGIKPGGVDFDSIDSIPSNIIVLTLSPKTAITPHVQFMSMISQVLDEKGRATLIACEKPKEMFKLLTGRMSKREIDGLLERKSVIDLSQIEDEEKPEMLKHLDKDLININMQGRTKQEIISELLDMLAKKGLVKNVRQARSAIMEREKQMSSGLTHGVAIPHARCDYVDGLVCAIGIKKAGVNFESLDGAISRIIVLTLSPKDAPGPHIQFMAMVSRVLNEKGRSDILESTAPEQVLDLFLHAAPTVEK